MLRILPVAFAAAFLGAVDLAQAEPVFPPGLRIGLEPPGDMRVSTRFPGFEDPDREVAITVLDMPAGAYPQLEASIFGKNQPALDEQKRESFPFDNGMAFLVTGRTRQNDETLHKWFFLTTASFGAKVQNLTTLITVQVPETARGIYTDAVVRKALQSVSFRPTPLEEQLGLLPFKLSERAGFRVMQVLPEGGVIVTDGPTDNINTQPYMIIGIGRGGPSEPSDRSRFARDMLLAAPMRDLTMRSSDAMRITGGPGHEIRATAKGLDGRPLSLVQWLRFGTGGFMRIIGVSSTDEWDSLFPRFRAVRDGIEPK